MSLIELTVASFFFMAISAVSALAFVIVSSRQGRPGWLWLVSFTICMLAAGMFYVKALRVKNTVLDFMGITLPETTRIRHHHAEEWARDPEYILHLKVDEPTMEKMLEFARSGDYSAHAGMKDFTDVVPNSWKASLRRAGVMTYKTSRGTTFFLIAVDSDAGELLVSIQTT